VRKKLSVHPVWTFLEPNLTPGEITSLVISKLSFNWDF
jgi:hypothetical protein